MSSSVSIVDVAKAAGVSLCTVSRVINGKTAGIRISPATRQRVLSVARQLGYQADPFARDIALGKPYRGAKSPRRSSDVKSSPTVSAPTPRQMGVILSATSPASTLGLIPGLIPTLTSADYQLVIVTLPTDPTAARERISQILDDGISGMLCCPTVYPAVSALSAGKCPTLVLWQDAGKAMLAKVAGSAEHGVPSGKTETGISVVAAVSGGAGVVITPEKPVTPAPIQEVPQGRAKLPAEPAIIQQATNQKAQVPPPGVITPVEPTAPPPQAPAPEPPVSEPVIELPPPVAPEPIPTVIPEPEVVTPPPAPAVIPEPVTPVFEPVPPPVVTTPVEPTAPPPQAPAPAPPVSEPIIELPPPVAPEPVPTVIPEPEVVTPPPAPAVIPELVTPVFEPVPPPVVITPVEPTAPPPQAPAPEPPVSEPVIELPPPVAPEPIPTVIPEPEIVTTPTQGEEHEVIP